tara:strand:+ start:36101 stop:37237 length:1137 start_codon:yes stop_codon:yes gene_type:complete
MSIKYKYDITYVFGKGRKSKLESDENSGNEFFYGYPYFEKKQYHLNIIETDEPGSNVYLKKFFAILDNLLARGTKLTFYMNALINKSTLSQIYNSKNIITSNHGIGMTLFIFIFFMKIRKRINFIVILSGLFAMRKAKFIVRVFRKIIFTLFLYTVDYLIFTNKSEYEFACEKYPRFLKKFVCLPFCIDTVFWKPENKIKFSQKKGILFIGNNGHRDFDLVVKIANKLDNIPFTFITNQIKDEEIVSSNVSNITGDWNMGYLTDKEIKDYYENSKLVILPIKNTLVSSGQSAGLQSAAMGTPVMTTATIGFWDYEKYKNFQNIIFVENNELENWVNLINKLYFDNDKLQSLSENGIQLINNSYTLEKFDVELEKFLNK